MDKVARSGFSRAAEAYERGRPDYPEGAVRKLLRALRLGPGSRVVELAAGTGKFTRALARQGIVPIAVEPVGPMRAALLARQPEVPVVGALAEKLPFRGGTLDAVLAAQAFHWFRADAALAEAARVVKPGGGLGLVWNLRDETVPWQRELTRLLDRYRPEGLPRARSAAWKGALARREEFGPLLHARFSHIEHARPGSLADRVRSVSFIALRPPKVRRALAQEVRRLADSLPRERPGGTIPVRYWTEVYWARREGAQRARRSQTSRHPHRAQRAGLARSSPW